MNETVDGKAVIETEVPHFMSGDGPVATEMRAVDWTTHSLGRPNEWPELLKSTLSTMLTSPEPMCLAWGPWGSDLPFLFNDAYRPILGQKAEGSLGRPFAAVWSDVWDDIAPMVRRSLDGNGQRFQNMPLTVTRNGYREETWWSFSYMPLRHGNGTVCGMLCVTSEETSRMRSVTELADSRERLTRLFQQAPGFMAMLRGPEHVIDLANPAYLRLVGHREVLGKTVAEALPDAVEQGYLELLDRVYRSGEAFASNGAKYAVQTEADGPVHERYVDFVFQPIRGAAGEVEGVFVEGADVTDRAAAELALRQGEARLRELGSDLERQVTERSRERSTTWQVSPDLLGALNADGRFVTSNPAWQSVLGWSEEEVAGMSIFELLHPDDVERTRVGFELTQVGTPAIRFPNRYRRKDGGYRWISWVGVPEDGLVYCSGRDITEEKQRSAEVRLLGNIVESTLAPICAFDAEFRLIAFNKAHDDEFFRVQGFRSRIGDVFPDLFVKEQRLKMRALMARALTGEAFTLTEEFGNPEIGVPVWELTYSPLRDEEGNVTGAFHYAQDISVRLRAEAELSAAREALRQSQKMEAVGQLTGGLAHDFNNLLAGISGSLEMMRTRIEQGRVGDIDRYIMGAQGAAKRAAALTHRLLAFSRRQTLDPKPTDVNRLVAGMEDLIARTVGPQVSIETVTTGGLWPTLVDPNQLENALLNLCINARDAMPEGGKLTIETANRWLDDRGARERDLPPGQYVSMCVSDNGTGMPADVIERAFDPFFTTKPIGVGTGLGLSMTYGFARQSGGQVRIYSEMGEGTMICVYLPRHHVKAEADPEASPAEIQRSDPGKTVLVIDDEALVRMLVVDVLEDMGFTALEAGDGPQGMKLIRSDARIDLLITDVGLPNGMNGRQVADAAREIRPGLKVMFITGYAENAVLSHGHLDPGMQVLTKPFDMSGLASRINAMILSEGSATGS